MYRCNDIVRSILFQGNVSDFTYHYIVLGLCGTSQLGDWVCPLQRDLPVGTRNNAWTRGFNGLTVYFYCSCNYNCNFASVAGDLFYYVIP